ncbi:SRPBCC family protein [Nocardioides sp. CFH 31398]|uniref:SRPBCC family protein n=1 Tax=Nocardioides sp. CFH 31398 TaxID=2919579 RepID=UPI001F06EA00|nr:SRPBCC family protein [Nocardioides sp. CFH 31398]MCH1865211.1 SRPBCC family protein [Nocardioides sp. CFH 31398]
MLTFRREVAVPHAAPGVFDYLADFTTVDEWDPRATGTHRLSGDGGQGSYHECDVESLGRSIPMGYTTTRVEQGADGGDRIEWVGSSRLVRAHDVIRLRRSEDGRGVVVDYTMRVTFERAPRTWDTVLRPAVRRLCDDAQDGMRHTLTARFSRVAA